MLSCAIHKWFFAKNQMSVAVIGNFMAFFQNAANETVIVFCTALVIAMNVRIMVKFDTAPCSTADFTGFIRIVCAGITDHIKAASGAVFFHCVEQNIRQWLSVKPIRRCRHSHRTIIERHRANALAGFDTLDTACISYGMLFDRCDKLFDDSFSLLTEFYNQ